MKTLAVLTFLAAMLLGTCFGQAGAGGSNIVENSANNAVVRSGSFIDASVFSGSDICAKINAAINYIGQNNQTSQPYGVTIDARGILPAVGSPLITCANNPFTGTYAAGITGRLLLPPALITTNAQWTMPNQYFWIEGTTMANQANSVGTIIRAGSSFSCGTGSISVTVPSPSLTGCPVVFISGTGFSTSGYDSFGTGIRNLTIDCNGISGCIGAGSFDVQEGGGIDSVGFINQTTACVVFDSPERSGGTGISNPFLRNVDCTFSTSASSTAIGVYVNAVDGPAEISNTTVAVPGSQSGSPIISACLELNGARGTNVNYLHCEHAAAAEVIGDSNIAHSITVSGLTASVTTLGVNIKNSSDYDITAESIDMEGVPNPFTGALYDATSNTTVTVGNLALYTTSVGGTVFTTDYNTTSTVFRFADLRLSSFLIGAECLPGYASCGFDLLLQRLQASLRHCSL